MFKVVFAETRGELEKILNERYRDAHVISINPLPESQQDKYTYEAWIKKPDEKDSDDLLKHYQSFLKGYSDHDDKKKVRLIDYLIFSAIGEL